MIRRGDAMVGLESIGQLKALIDRLGRIPRKVAIEAQPGINRLLQTEFRSGKDPYGNPWAPLRPSTLAQGRRPPPLSDTKRLRDGTEARLGPGNSAGLRIVLGERYGYFHQVGFRVGKTRAPPRRVLPQFGLPTGWKLVLDKAAARAAREAVGGR